MKTKDTQTLVYLTFESNTLTVRNDNTDIKPSCAFQLLLKVHFKTHVQSSNNRSNTCMCVISL